MILKRLPPRGLYLPLLPYKQKTKGSHKLLFGLCRTCMNKIDEDCGHINFSTLKTREEKSYAKKHCRQCHAYRNESCSHTDEERSLTGTWATPEIEKAIELGYKILDVYEVDHFNRMSKELFNQYVKTFYKIKQESSGCPCKEKVCPLDCPEKLAYIAENKRIYNIDLDSEEIIKNEGLNLFKQSMGPLWYERRC